MKTSTESLNSGILFQEKGQKSNGSSNTHAGVYKEREAQENVAAMRTWRETKGTVKSQGLRGREVVQVSSQAYLRYFRRLRNGSLQEHSGCIWHKH